MNYEQFKDLWTWALRESGLPIQSGESLEETLDLRSADRRCKSFVHLPSDRVAAFSVIAGACEAAFPRVYSITNVISRRICGQRSPGGLQLLTA